MKLELKKEIEESISLISKLNHSVKWEDLKSGNFKAEGNPVVERELLIRLANIVDSANKLLLELEK